MIVFYLFLAIIIAYYIIKVLYKKFWDYRLFVDVFLPDEILHEGDTTSILEVIINDKFLPLTTLETRFVLDRGLGYIGNTQNSSLSDKLYRRDAFLLGIKQKISRTFEIVCLKRGYYTLEKLDLISSDIFLQEKFLGSRTIFQDFYVFPKKVQSSKIAFPFRQINGDLAVKKMLYEDPFSFAGVRDYTPTDTLNSINWKASAKTQDLVVNTYESSTKQNVYIILDTFDNENLAKEGLNEESIRICSAIIERLIHQGIEVVLLTNSVDMSTEKKLDIRELNGIPINVIKQNLARISLGDEQAIDGLLEQVPKDNYAVVISKNYDLEQEISSKLDAFYWIIPYSDEIPTISLTQDKFHLWKAETLNLLTN